LGNVVWLENHSVVGKGGKFREDTFSVASGVWGPVECELFTACREAYTEVFFDQLEVPVVMAEQNRGICAFSKLKFTHER
jgi:hypothetical protein